MSSDEVFYCHQETTREDWAALSTDLNWLAALTKSVYYTACSYAVGRSRYDADSAHRREVALA